MPFISGGFDVQDKTDIVTNGTYDKSETVNVSKTEITSHVCERTLAAELTCTRKAHIGGKYEESWHKKNQLPSCEVKGQYVVFISSPVSGEIISAHYSWKRIYIQKSDNMVITTVLGKEKIQMEALKSVAGLAQHNGDVVMLRNAEGRDHLLSAFESSLRDIAVFSLREIRLSEGDLVRFTRQDREQGWDTQTLWEVTRITGNGDITLKNGENTRLIQPGREMPDMHLDGYTGTAHRAQGASEAFVIALAGAPGASPRLASLSDAYVALSRMKQHTDDIGKWQVSVAASESRKTAHDVLDVQQDVYATIAQKLWHNARPLNQWQPQISGTACGLAGLRPEWQTTGHVVSGNPYG